MCEKSVVNNDETEHTGRTITGTISGGSLGECRCRSCNKKLLIYNLGHYEDTKDVKDWLDKDPSFFEKVKRFLTHYLPYIEIKCPRCGFLNKIDRSSHGYEKDLSIEYVNKLVVK